MTEGAKSLGSVSLAAGSYDAEQLRAGLDKAAGAKAEDQPGKVGEAVSAAVVSGGTDGRDPALPPDHVFADVDNGHGGKERVQVYAPPLAEQHEGPIQTAGEEVDPDAEREKQRRGAIGQAVKGAEKPPAEEARDGESRTGAADPVAAEDDTISAAAPAVEAAPAEAAPTRRPSK